DEALRRYTALAAHPAAELKRPQFRIEAAELKARLGRRDESVKDLQALLGDLPPDDWVARDARRRLEEVFLRKDDLAGLVQYYEGWLAKNADDLVVLDRLAHHLVQQGRAADARAWLTKGLERAPRDAGLRRELITLLAGESKFAEAAAQYELLDKYE